MMISDEIKKRAQTIGLDLTKNKNDEITSGYIHFEETNYIPKSFNLLSLSIAILLTKSQAI